MNAQLVPLGDIAKIDMGQAPKGDSYNELGDGVPLIAGASDFGSINPTPSRFTNAPTKVSQIGDVIVCIRATIGDLNYSDRQYCLGRGVAGLRPKNGKIDERYLWRALEASADRLRSKGRGATFLQVSKSDIANLEIPLPLLEEQKRIAAILDQTEALRRLRQRAIDRLNTLGQAIFHEMFDGPNPNRTDFLRLELSEIVREGDKINYGVVQPGDSVEDGVPLVRVGDLLKPLVNQSDLKRISRSIEEKYSRSRLNGDEILVACVGSIGAVALADTQMSGFNIARAVARLPVDDVKVNRLFLAEQLKTHKIQRYFKSETRAVAQPTLNIKQLKETEIFLPPMKKQLEFAGRLEGVRNHLSLQARGMEKIEILFASLQNRAFRREL